MDSVHTQQALHLPNTLADWPWPRAVNSHYEDCKRMSAAWAEGLGAFGPKAQIAFNKCDFSLLASMAYAKLDKEGCQVGCDLMNLFFIFDEWSDNSDECDTRQQADAIMDALRNPNKIRLTDEWVGGEATRQFWLNAIQTATKSAQQRFLTAFQRYTDAVVQQSADRTQGRIRDIQSYFDVRRETIGARPSFVINAILDDLSDGFVDLPVVERLTSYCIDMLIIGNDLCSYNVEQSRGDSGHNIVTVIMQQTGSDVQDAINWIGNLHDDIARRFLADYANLADAIGDIDQDLAEKIKRYVDALGNWIRANDQWSFETERYFGRNGLLVQKTRKVALMPKIDALKPIE